MTVLEMHLFRRMVMVLHHHKQHRIRLLGELHLRGVVLAGVVLVVPAQVVHGGRVVQGGEVVPIQPLVAGMSKICTLLYFIFSRLLVAVELEAVPVLGVYPLCHA